MTRLPAPEPARQGVQIRAQRIGGGLRLLSGLFTLLALLSLGGLTALWALSGAFWQELGAGRALPRLIFGLSCVLTALYYLPSLLALSAARRAVLRLRDFALEPRGVPAELPSAAGRFIRWLGFWQWSTLASAALGLGLVAASFSLSPLLLPDSKDLSLGGPQTLLVLLSALLQSGPSVVLTWLVLASIKRFFAAALSHARGAAVPVTPAATAAGGWLVLTLVVLGLGLAATVLSALLFLVAAAVPGLEQTFAGSAAFGFSAALFQRLMWGLAAVLLLSALLSGLLMALVAWSRGFALDVAALLDARAPAATFMNVSLGPWKTVMEPTALRPTGPKPPGQDKR